jgi:hypothetical protein
MRADAQRRSIASLNLIKTLLLQMAAGGTAGYLKQQEIIAASGFSPTR